MTLRAERLKRDLAFFFFLVHSGFCELACATISLPLWPPPPTVRAARPTPPAQGRGQSKACWDGGGWGVRGVSWHRATFPWLPGLTGGKEGGCCVSDWWGQVCGLGIECCRTDVLLAHPALSAARPPALRTRLIGTPNCPYEYFRGEQEWEFRVGGMVSRAMTANDPLNDQRERERERRRETEIQGVEMVRTMFNNLYVNAFCRECNFLWSVSNVRFLFLYVEWEQKCVFPFFLICR